MAEMALAQAPDNHIPNHGNSSAPARVPEIQAAWAKAVAEHGPPQFDNDVPADETESVTEEPETAPETPAAKTGKDKAKEEPEAEPEAEAAVEEPAEKVTVRDLIEQRARAAARFERREKALDDDYRQRHQKVDAAVKKFMPLAKAADAIDSGEADELAKHLCEYRGIQVKTWSELSSELLANMQSPVRKELRELKQAQERDRAELAERKRAEQEHFQNAEQARVHNEWKRSMADELAEDEDPAIASLIDLKPQMADIIMQHQGAHFHKTSGATLPHRSGAEKALESVVADFKIWREFFEKNAESPVVKKLLGNQSTPNKTAVSGGPQRAEISEKRAGKPATKTVSHTRGASAVAVGQRSSEQLLKEYARKMQSEMDRNPNGSWGADLG